MITLRNQALCEFISNASPQVYARLHVHQREKEIRGHVAEVGVYLGKSFAPLALLKGGEVTTFHYNAFTTK